MSTLINNPADAQTNVFAVYGTLRKGQRANHMLKDAKYLGTDTVQGTLLNIGAYPGYLPSPESHSVVVDLYEVECDENKRVLDSYEGYPILYEKTLVVTDRRQTLANIYVWNSDRDYPVIETGDWENQ